MIEGRDACETDDTGRSPSASSSVSWVGAAALYSEDEDCCLGMMCSVEGEDKEPDALPRAPRGILETCRLRKSMEAAKGRVG